MEIDISRKVGLTIKFALPAVIFIAVLLNICIWLYGQHNAYIEFYDARVVGTFLQTKTLTDGTLEKLLVKDGEDITTGQAIAQIRPNVTQKDIDNLQQTVDQAQQQYDNMVSLSKQGSTRTITQPAVSGTSAADDGSYQAALANESKMKNLYDLGAVSRAEYDNAAAAVESARAAMAPRPSVPASSSVITTPSGVTQEDLQMSQTRLNQAKMALEEAQKNTGLTELHASASGTAYYTDAQEGTSVTAGQNILNIATSNYLWLEIKTTEQQAVKLQEGSYAECKINGESIGGTVAQITPPDADEKEYTVKIFIPSDKMGGISPNMLATVKIPIKK